MKYPGELYVHSATAYQELPNVEYPFHDKTFTLTRCRRICINTKKINFRSVFAGQKVGISEIEDKIHAEAPRAKADCYKILALLASAFACIIKKLTM